MNPFRAVACLVGVGLLGAIACSGDDFESNPAPDGGAGTDASGSGGSTGGSGGSTGGSGGSTGGSAGTTGGTSGAAGSGGAPPCSDGKCAADEYCHSDGSCRKCFDTNELEFGAPEALANVNSAHTVPLLAPRPVDEPTHILYVAGTAYTTRKIWYTDNLELSPGLALPAPLDGAQPDGGADLGENAPLVTAGAGDGPLKGIGLFFDRSTAGFGRRLWGAPIDAAANIGPPVELPSPFNPSDGSSSWEIAHAPVANRVWFMSNREGIAQPKLYTTTTGPGTPPTPVAVSLITGPNNCVVENNVWEADRAPWVLADGSALMFHARESAPGCTYGNKTDMFIVPLKTDGQTAGLSAFPLPMNEPNTNDMSPAFSWDMCWLYFASDRNLSANLKLFRARRI